MTETNHFSMVEGIGLAVSSPGKLVERKGTAEERRLRALRRISDREFD